MDKIKKGQKVIEHINTEAIILDPLTKFWHASCSINMLLAWVC